MTLRPSPRCRAFSLMEVTIAIGIAGFALVTLLAVLPQAMQDAGASADQTAIGMILEDVHDRLEGAVLKEGVLTESPFYYDQRGVFYDKEYNDGTITTERFFRAEVKLVKIQSNSDSVIPGMLAVKIDLFWPLDEKGNPLSKGAPETSVTYFTAAKTGPGWEAVDSSYQAKIEY